MDAWNKLQNERDLTIRINGNPICLFMRNIHETVEKKLKTY